MHKDFEESNPRLSHTRYYEEVKAMNIAFVTLGEEECELCDLITKKVEKVFFQG